jgi:hypothetical protein
MKTLLLAAVLTLQPGCATPYQHWLTDEEDARLREQCEARACVMVPGDLWERIKAALQAALGTRL